VLENRGSRHAILEKPSISLRAGKTTGRVPETEVYKALSGENILAGGTRSLSLPWPEGLPVGPIEAKLSASFLQ
jgi:fimbrial chaperone protein